MVSFELLGRTTSPATLSSEQKHRIVDQAEVEKRSQALLVVKSITQHAQPQLTHGALANQQDDWPRLAAATSSSMRARTVVHS